MLLKTVLILATVLTVHCDNENASFKEMVMTQIDALKSRLAEVENKLLATYNENVHLRRQLKFSKR